MFYKKPTEADFENAQKVAHEAFGHLQVFFRFLYSNGMQLAPATSGFMKCQAGCF